MRTGGTESIQRDLHVASAKTAAPRNYFATLRNVPSAARKRGATASGHSCMGRPSRSTACAATGHTTLARPASATPPTPELCLGRTTASAFWLGSSSGIAGQKPWLNRRLTESGRVQGDVLDASAGDRSLDLLAGFHGVAKTPPSTVKELKRMAADSIRGRSHQFDLPYADIVALRLAMMSWLPRYFERTCHLHFD